MKINYQLKLLELIKQLRSKPKVLLHSCCGPCSSSVIDFLKDYFEITVYYYNPNIEPEEEYLKRKDEQIRYIKELSKQDVKIDFLDSQYEHELYEKAILGLEKEKEGSIRCSHCFYLRLKKTALKAKELNFDYFGTTLSVSPHKNSQVINEIGEKVSEEVGVAFIYGDFKKNDGYKKSIDLAKKYNLYRQNYCGCLNSKRIDK